MATNLYEGMFLVDAGKGGSDHPETIRHIAGLLDRIDADIERIEKWEERKLAYIIKRAKRGIYILVYFRADGSRIAELRRDIKLSEELLRALILRADEPDPVTGDLYSPDGNQIEEREAATAAGQPAETSEAAGEQ